jgi:HAD superfamily hydrolase (TIGR01509 family)
MMIKAVMFDWFGVFTEKFVDTWCRDLEGKLDIEKFRKTFIGSFDRYAVRKVTGREFVELVLDGTGLEPKDYEYLLWKLGEVREGMLRFVLELRKMYRTALLTDIFDEILSVIEKRLGGLDRYFDVHVESNRLGMIKTDRRFFGIALEKLGVSTGEAVLIEDRPVNIETAKGLGINTIFFKDEDSLKKELVKLGVKW